jgi:hypothetical protein
MLKQIAAVMAASCGLAAGSLWAEQTVVTNSSCTDVADRFAAGKTIEFANSKAYKSYRVPVTSVRTSDAGLTQISEATLFGK